MKLQIKPLAAAVGASLLCAALPAFSGEFRTTDNPIDGQYIVVLEPDAARLAGESSRAEPVAGRPRPSPPSTGSA